MLIDIHTHCGVLGAHYTDEFYEEMYAPFGIPLPKKTPPGCEVDGLVKRMDEAGIDKSVLLACDEELTMNVKQSSQYVAEQVARYPDRLIGFAGVDPMKGKEAMKELERGINDWGLKGLKILPTYQHYAANDERVFPFYEKCVELDIPVLIHQAWTPVIDAPMKYQHPYLLDDVAIKFRDLRIIMAHFGFPWIDEAIFLLAKHKNIYTDLSAWNWFPPEYLAQTLSKAKSMFPRVLPDKILMGSEGAEQKSVVENIRRVNSVIGRMGLTKLTDEEIDKILGKNAEKLLRL